MNKKQICIVIFACLAVLVGVEIVLQQKHSAVSDYRIALFVPAVHPAMTEIVNGFEETIKSMSDKKYSFDEYNANGNPTLLRAQTDEIVQQGYDLVFTVGAHCSQSIFELSKKRKSRMAQVFGAVEDPFGIGIVKPVPTAEDTVTGVVEVVDYNQQIDALLHVKPNVKTILLVYNPTQGRGLEKNREELEKVLQRKNIALHTVTITHQNEITQKVPAFLTDIDVIMILIDNTVVAGIDSLVTLCGRYGVTLLASDLNSGDKGAALAFGAHQRDYGSVGARMVFDILEKQQSPGSITVSPLPDQLLKINTKTMEQQGLHLSKERLVQLQKEGVIII